VSLAHTADEYVELADLERAVHVYVDLARSLVERCG
jgi:acetylornithine deacetylase/succinyl-diaminopimelate desuccinylase-like protein